MGSVKIYLHIFFHLQPILLLLQLRLITAVTDLSKASFLISLFPFQENRGVQLADRVPHLQAGGDHPHLVPRVSLVSPLA